jgi:hypothetical protein
MYMLIIINLVDITIGAVRDCDIMADQHFWGNQFLAVIDNKTCTLIKCKDCGLIVDINEEFYTKYCFKRSNR